MPPKLGEILICANVIDQQQLESALSAQQKWGGKLGEILVNTGLCSEEMMVKALSRQLDIARAELDRIASVPPDILHKIPLDLSLALDVLPLELRDGDTLLVVAMSDPLNTRSIDILTEKTRCRIHALLAGPHAIARSRARLYHIEDVNEDIESNALKALSSRGKIVVKGIPGYGKLINRETLALSGSASALPTRKPFAETPPNDRPMGTEVEGAPSLHFEDIEAAPRVDSSLRAIQAALHQNLAILNALVETLVEKNIFSREEFLKNLKNSEKE